MLVLLITFGVLVGGGLTQPNNCSITQARIGQYPQSKIVVYLVVICTFV